MKIGIIIFSKTGNTESVGRRIMDMLVLKGHTVKLEQVTADNDDQTVEAVIKLKTIPNISSYDALILGSPVRGFSLSAVMSAYISQLRELKGIKVFCFVTQFFPFPSMGGKQAIEQMKRRCQAKGAVICGTSIINWSNLRREKMIRELVEDVGHIF